MRLRCRIGKHEWSEWRIDTHEVPLWLEVTEGRKRIGWSYEQCLPPPWRGCKHCPALERKLPGE